MSGARSRTSAASATRSPALPAGAPSTITSPASTSARARSRLAASPRSRRRTSSRFLGAKLFSDDGLDALHEPLHVERFREVVDRAAFLDPAADVLLALLAGDEDERDL